MDYKVLRLCAPVKLTEYVLPSTVIPFVLMKFLSAQTSSIIFLIVSLKIHLFINKAIIISSCDACYTKFPRIIEHFMLLFVFVFCLLANTIILHLFVNLKDVKGIVMYKPLFWTVCYGQWKNGFGTLRWRVRHA